MKNIKVLDDDIYIGDMLEEMLSREGYGVRRAYSGTEALLLLEQKSPDLVLLDLMLPGLSGEEVLSKITGIPVIVLSAKAEVSGKVRLLLKGAADYITKPFDMDELLARVTVQLRNAAVSGKTAALTFEELTLEVDSHEVRAGEKPVRLTKTEYPIFVG